jgi:hydroxymethylpyrimidine pyrophosphatase-like HAD family hydrolase
MAALGQSATLVYSSNRDLDVLPADVHKGAAAAFLARTWNIDPRRIIVAGDSGNDATMFQMGFRGVVVANAQPELRALVGRYIYHAEQAYAAGVLEGVRHWQERARAVG